MNNFKNIQKLLIFTFFVLLSTSGNTKENQTKINLIDKGKKPLLENYNKTGFFNSDMYTVNIVKPFKDFIPSENEITIDSNVIDKDGKELHFYRVNFPTSLGKMSAQWSLDNNQRDNEFNDIALEESLNFATKSKDKNPNSIFSNHSLNSNFKDIKIEYDKNNMVKSYSMTYYEKPSDTYRFWRTVAEISMFSLLGEANYWITKDENIEDWEYKPTWNGFKKKITDGWSLDTNNFRTNTIYHAYAGALYYQSARSNGYGYGASAMFSFFGSLMWEYVGEFREQVSTNDMIWTPFAGSIMGEGMRQLSIFAEERMDPGFFRNLIMFVMDPMRIINNYLDAQYTGSFKIRLHFESPIHKAVNDYASHRLN